MPRTQNPPLDHIKKAQLLRKIAAKLNSQLVTMIFCAVFGVLLLVVGITTHSVTLIILLSLLYSIFLASALLHALNILFPGISPIEYGLNRFIHQLESPYILSVYKVRFSGRLKNLEVIEVFVHILIPDFRNTESVRERLSSSVQSAIAWKFAELPTVPSYGQIQVVIDRALDDAAKHLPLPIYFAEIQDRSNARLLEYEDYTLT